MFHVSITKSHEAELGRVVTWGDILRCKLTVKDELRWEAFFLRVRPSAFLSQPLYSNHSLSPGVSTISTIIYRPSCHTFHPREDRNLKESSRKDTFLKSRFSSPSPPPRLGMQRWVAIETMRPSQDVGIGGFWAEGFFAFNDALTNKQKSLRSYPFDPSWRSLVNVLLACMPCKSH